MQNVLNIAYGIWLLSEILLARFMRSKVTDPKNKDKKSLSIIWLTIVASITCSIFISFNIALPLGSWIYAATGGVSLIALGIVLRLWIISTLGRFFTVDVTIQENHQLKTDGFYRILRHPSYTASLITFTGFGISLNNWLSFLIVAVAVSSAFIYRIKVEEKALIEQFGEEYLRYQRSTPALIPFIY